MCILTGLQVLRFLRNLHLPCCVSPSSLKGFFLQKELPKKLFMGEVFGKNLWGVVH